MRILCGDIYDIQSEEWAIAVITFMLIDSFVSKANRSESLLTDSCGGRVSYVVAQRRLLLSIRSIMSFFSCEDRVAIVP